MAESNNTVTSAPSGFIGRLASAAIDVNDSELMCLRKTVLLLASGLMNIAAILWLAIYWWMGLKLPTTIPFGFQVLSALAVYIFLRTQNFEFFRFIQLALFLFFPFVVQWSIGSFVSSSGIALLALLAPIGAMIRYRPPTTRPIWSAMPVSATPRG